ncbi:MAG: DMT family transporter, partial [Gammaproteobacteria bacterium]|nr:DMT family transporter [Gammaproteobacteria bacterium]
MSTSSAISVRRHYLGIGLILLASLGFAIKGIFIKLAYAIGGDIDAISLMVIRMLISMPFFIGVAIFYSRSTTPEPMQRADILRILYLGFIGYYLSSYLDFTGLNYISASLERLILYLYPTFVMLLTVITVRRAPRKQEILALGFSYLGIGLVFALELSIEGTEIITGGLAVLAAAMSFAFFMVGSQKAILRMGTARFTAYSMLVASAMIFIHYLCTHEATIFAMPAGFYLYGLALALFSTVFPAFMMNA